MDQKFPIASFLTVGTLSCIALIYLYSAPPSHNVNNTLDREGFAASPRADHDDSDAIAVEKLRRIVASYLGVRYKTGGMDRRGFDCSGFVVVVFRELCRARLPRSTRYLKRVGRQVSRKDARPGDLVFFKRGRFGSINHVGIYMGNGTFAHASSSHGIRYDRLDDEYYTNHFAMIRRILP